MSMRWWLSDYDDSDGVHSYARMNVHMDDVESHRSDLVLLEEWVPEKNQGEDGWLCGRDQ